MKQPIKWFSSALAVAGVVAIVYPAQAQYITGDPTLDNVPMTGGILAGGSSIGPAGLTITEPAAFGYGWGECDIPTANQVVINPLDTLCVMNFTMNSPTPGAADASGVPAWSWSSFEILISVNGGSNERYCGDGGGYDGYNGTPPGVPIVPIGGYRNTDPGWVYNGNGTVTVTSQLDATTLAAIRAGGATITDFQVSCDPISLASGYTMTYNSILLTVPEPATMALLGLSAAGLLIFRRRK